MAEQLSTLDADKDGDQQTGLTGVSPAVRTSNRDDK